MTFVLIGVNVIVSLVAFSSLRDPAQAGRYLFSPYQVARGRNLSGMLLSQMSHADAGHLFFNMLTLYFFAPPVVYVLGNLQMLLIYAAAGICATLLTFFFHRDDPYYRALGASGSVSGVVFAAIVLYPSMNLYLFFIPVPIPGPVFALGYVGLSIYLARRQAGHIGHEAHIGGALAGFILAGMLSSRGYMPLIERVREML